MRKSLLVIAVLLLPGSTALAEPPDFQKSEKAALGKALPLKGASSASSCAAYGPGFVKVEGSGTCVRVGGAISVGVGASRGAR
jgi:hypothetical protein